MFFPLHSRKCANNVNCCEMETRNPKRKPWGNTKTLRIHKLHKSDVQNKREKKEYQLWNFFFKKDVMLSCKVFSPDFNFGMRLRFQTHDAHTSINITKPV